MRVFVRMSNGEIIPMQVEPGSSVKSVKAQLRAEQGITASRLLLDFEPLDDAHTLADCNVSAEAVLECEPDDVLDLQLLLFLPKGGALFQSVCARLGQVQQLGAQADILLQSLVGDGCEDLQTRLRKLPHLDETEYNTREHTALDRAAYDLSISKEPIDARLLQYFFEVLNRFMTSEKPEPRQHVLFLIISMILRNAIACGLSLAPGSGPAYDQVRMVLSGTELSSPTLLTKEVIRALTVLCPILQRASKESRLDARSICEVFRLPLELPQMLSLSIDGVKPEEKQEVGKLVLVIGITGSGKSTLINCLTGIEYELCEDVTTGITFLQPKEGQPVPPAKVGHDVSSQTLYPQIIPAKDGPFCFCDCPGFDDNRRGDEAICAALGVPLAVHYSKKISAIILTVNYGFTEGRGNSLRLLNQTLSGIIKLPEQIQNFPLFFAFTKPPERKGAFQTSLLRKQLAVRISKIFAEATQQARSLPTKEQKLAKLEEELLVLSMSLDELQTLKKSAMDLGKARAGISIMAGLLGGFELIDISRIEKKVTELKAGWRERKFHERSVNDLGDTVRRGLHLQCREKGLAFLAEISRQIDVWKEGKVNLETQIKALMQDIDHIRGEEAILGLMLKQSANMFIIRGFKGAAQDEDDDLQRLYQAVSAETSEISREQFLFDPNNRTFDAVRQWIEGFSDQFTPKLQQMLFLQDDITNRLTTAIKDARLNIEQTKEDILSEVKGESDDHIAKSLKTQIERRSETLRKIKDHETQLRDESHHSEEEIERIRAAPVRDFRSELIDKSGWRFLPFGWSCRYDFHQLDIFTRFFEKSGKSAIPIERVELSCVQENDDQKRVLFQTAIQEQFVDRNLAQNITANPAMQFEERAQNVHVVKSNQGSTVYGHFVVKQNKLDKGKFSATYYSDEERKGRCAVRVFVLPQNLPAERTRMRELELKLRDNRKDIENIAAKSSEISRNIASDKEYLALVKAGNRNQKSKILRIVELLSRLGACHEQELVNLFGLDEATLASFQWLRNPAHSRRAQSLLRFKGQGFPEANLGINLRTLLAVMGVNLSLRVAVVESTQEVDGQRASLKLGEALLYRLEKKLRVLYKASDKSVDKFPILENHDYYNILLNGMTQGEGSGMGDFHAIALRVVYGVLQDTILTERKQKGILNMGDPEVQNKLKKLVEILPEDFLSHMHAVSRTTGFSIPSIHAILIGLKQPNDLEYAAVQALKKLEIEKALGEFFFTKLRCIYEASEKQLLTVEEIIALLNCGNQHAVACFLQCSRELRSKDLSQITYSVSEELAEIVEREVVDQKDYFQQKNKYSDVEWASVVSGFKERAILWTGCYPDNTQVEFESMDVMTSNHPLVMVGLTGETARPLLLENPDDSMRATLAPECLAFLKREHQLPDQLQAKWDQLRQNAQILETQGKDLLAELGLEHKLVSLQYFISNTFRATANNAPNTLATKCATFIQTVQDHFGGFSELDERLGAHSRSHDAFVKYCKNLLDAKQVGPQTIAMVAKLSNFDVVIWEQQPASRVLRAKVTSNLNNKERIHLLLLPSENGTYKYAMLFLFRPVRMHLSSADELVGPGEVDGEVKHNTPLAQEEEVPLDLEEKVPLEQLEEKVPLDLEEEVPLGLEEEVPLDLEEKVPLDLEGKVPLDFEEKAPQALPNIEEAINVNNEAHSQQSEPPIDADPQQREEISPANPDS